jgi:hypothetical protein
LIEAESIEALEREHGIELDGADARRNVVTRGVDLRTGFKSGGAFGGLERDF